MSRDTPAGSTASVQAKKQVVVVIPLLNVQKLDVLVLEPRIKLLRELCQVARAEAGTVRAALSLHLANRACEADLRNWIQNNASDIVLHVSHSLPGEPATEHWRRIHDFFFSDPCRANVLVYLDRAISRVLDDKGVLMGAEKNTLREGLKTLIGKASSAAYVLGDYEPVPWPPETTLEHVAIKVEIEEKVHKTMDGLFGDLLKACKIWKGLKRVRSEFHAISRALYEELVRRHKDFLPAADDYGLEMLLVALVRGMEVERVEDFGKVPEPKKYTREDYDRQVARVATQLKALDGHL